MKATPEPLEIYDEENDRLWTIPRERITTVIADVSERWVANVIVPRRMCEALIGLPFLEPTPAPGGQYILSLCAIFMRHAAPPWAPLKMGPASRNCALRVACTDLRTGAPAVWVDHRYSDSALVTALAKLGFPKVHADLVVTMDRDTKRRRQIKMCTGDQKIDLHLVEQPNIKRAEDLAFADAQAFENYFGAGVRSYGPGKRKGHATMVDLHKRSDNHFEAMDQYFGVLRTAYGNRVVDSVYRTQDGLYEWRYEGDVCG